MGKEQTPSLDLLHEKPLEEHAAILGRFAVLQEMGLGFTEDRMYKIARNEVKGYQFWGAITKAWNGIYGSRDGLSLAEAETIAMTLDVYDDVFGYRDKK